MSPDRVLEVWPLLRCSLIVAGVAYPVLLLWSARMNRAASNAHRMLLEWVFLGSIGTVMSSFVLVRGANIVLDFHAAEALAIHELKLFEVYRRKVGTSYRVSFSSDDPRFSPGTSIAIDPLHYHRLKRTWFGDTQDSATLLVHPGALGFAWLELVD